MNITTDQIKKILADAVWYPSGDNSQPWTFKWANDNLNIYHNVERAEHPLNAGGVASAMSLGCLVEGLSISSSQFQCKIEVQYHDFSMKKDGSWASVKFSSDTRPVDPLLKFINERATDRRLFNKGELPTAAIESATKNRASESLAKIYSITKISPELSNYIMKSERLMMEHPMILPKILHWTRFSDSETQTSRDGLSLNNMLVKFWEVPALKMIKKYPGLVPYLKGMMLSQHMKRVQKQLESSAGLVCVTIPKNSDLKSIPDAGRAMFRTWLVLNQSGYGVQPLTIASMLIYCSQQDLLDLSFSPWIQFYKDGEAIMRKAFLFSDDQTPVWMIRTGKADPLPLKLRTLRKSIDDILSIGES